MYIYLRTYFHYYFILVIIHITKIVRFSSGIIGSKRLVTLGNDQSIFFSLFNINVPDAISQLPVAGVASLPRDSATPTLRVLSLLDLIFIPPQVLLSTYFINF